MVVVRLSFRVCQGILGSLVCCLAPLLAQSGRWAELRGAADRGWTGAFDSRRGRFVRFEDGIVHERGPTGRIDFDIGAPPVFAPVARRDAAMVFDAARGETILFGGTLTSTFGDMWAWNGLAWRRVNLAVSPPRRSGAVATWDPVNRRVLMFGGQDGAALLGDFWSWDGTTWTLLDNGSGGAGGPMPGSALLAHRAATDRPQILSPSGHFEFVQGQWQLASNMRLGPGHAFGYDPVRDRIVSYEGAGLARISEWDGTTWSTPWTGLPIVTEPRVLFFDPALGRLVVGGEDSVAFTWDGVAPVTLPWATVDSVWSPWVASFVDPVRREVVVITRRSGLNLSTLVWNGANWRDAGAGPSLRQASAAAWDGMHGVGVLFGGAFRSVLLGDTWIRSGANWSLASVSGPSPRLMPLMAHDSARGRTILAGGVASSILADVWEWDGAVWTPRGQVPRPVFAATGAMEFDPVRARTVLLVDRQTFEWDGVLWTTVATPSTPPTSSTSRLVFDSVLQRQLLCDAHLTAIWEYDGVDWRPTALPDMNLPSAYHALREPRRQRLQLVSTDGVLELEQTAGSRGSLGAPCGDLPAVLMTRGRPVVGDPDFGLEVGAVPSALTLLALAGGPASAPLPNGCTRWIGAPLAVLAAVADARGLAAFAAPVPSAASLAGLAFHAQGVVFGAQFAGGFAASQGLRIVLGD